MQGGKFLESTVAINNYLKSTFSQRRTVENENNNVSY